MRSWMLAVACAWMGGCIVYKDSNDSDWHSGSTWSSSTTPAPREGQVEVSWQVGAQGCEAAGVETIEVDLDGYTTAFACADEAATVSVRQGRYRLILRGLDADGVARYEGDGGQVRVHNNQVTAAPTVVLSALPVTIEASWFFDNGRLCSQNGVSEIEANLFDSEDVLKGTQSVPCDVGVLAFEEVEADAYALLLLGRDGGGAVRYSGEGQIDAERGDRLDLEIVLLPED